MEATSVESLLSLETDIPLKRPAELLEELDTPAVAAPAPPAGRLKKPPPLAGGSAFAASAAFFALGGTGGAVAVCDWQFV